MDKTISGTVATIAAAVLIIGAYLLFDDWAAIAVAILLVWGMLYFTGYATAT